MNATPLTLPPAVSGTRFDLDTRAGRIACYSAGPAAPAPAAVPLLLIHSVNAAASAYEVRPLYEHYRAARTVYAPDLPGYGWSDRSDREYSPRLMTDAIHAVVDEIRRIHGPVRIDALALSLSSEFLARAAAEAPGVFRSLALVSPTGFDRRAPYRGAPGSTRGMPWLRRLFAGRPWSAPFFNLLTSRRSVRFFLEKTWGAKSIDEGLLEYDLLTTRQPGAQHAPYWFVSGYLFSADITSVYESLRLPIWMCHGVRGDFVDYRYQQALRTRQNWHFDGFETGALPHFELLPVFVRRYDAFLDSLH